MREIDVLLVGISSSLGKHVLEYFVDNIRLEDIRWAVGGDRGNGLTLWPEFRDCDVPILPLDLGDVESMKLLFENSNVVINCCTSKESEGIVRACIESQTDFVDISEAEYWDNMGELCDAAEENQTLGIIGVDVLSFCRDIGVAHSKKILSPGQIISSNCFFHFKSLDSLLELRDSRHKMKSSLSKRTLPPKFKYYTKSVGKDTSWIDQKTQQELGYSPSFTAQSFYYCPSLVRFIFLLLFVYCIIFLLRFIVTILSGSYNIIFESGFHPQASIEAIVQTTSLAPYYVPSTSKSPPYREVSVIIQPPANQSLQKSTALCLCVSAVHIFNEKKKQSRKSAAGIFTIPRLYNRDFIKLLRENGWKIEIDDRTNYQQFERIKT